MRDARRVAQAPHEATRTHRGANAEYRPNGRAESTTDPPTKHLEAQGSVKKYPGKIGRIGPFLIVSFNG
jgi:hypothetical protein